MPISRELLPFSSQFFIRLAAVFAEEIGDFFFDSFCFRSVSASYFFGPI